MKRIKYVGEQDGITEFVGLMKPGEEREVEDKIAKYLLRGMFELVKDKKVKKGE